MDWVGLGLGWDLCAGLLYEHRFAMLIMRLQLCQLFWLNFYKKKKHLLSSLFNIFIYSIYSYMSSKGTIL